MNTQEFRDAVANAKKRPKGVKVSTELLHQLQSEGAVSLKPFALLPDTFMFDLRVYDGDIYLHEEITINDGAFLLPPSSL